MIEQLAAAARAAAGFQASLERLRVASKAAGAKIAVLKRRLAQLQAIPSAPRNFDRADRTWQTDVCAAWLHGDCPFPGVCDCTCHGGSRR